MKFGCAGLIQLAAIMGAASLLMSALGLSIAVVLCRGIARQLRLSWLLLTTSILTALLLAMFYTVGYWPLESVATYFVIWAAVPFGATGLLLMVARKLAPNNSFKPTPLRGAA